MTRAEREALALLERGKIKKPPVPIELTGPRDSGPPFVRVRSSSMLGRRTSR